MEDVERANESHLAISDMNRTEEFSSEVVDLYGDEDHKKRFQALQIQAQSARDSNDTSQARRTEEELGTLAAKIYWEQPGAWIANFQALTDGSHFVDPDKAETLIKEGNNALEVGDSELLKSIVIELWNLAEESDREGPEARLMWLRRA